MIPVMNEKKYIEEIMESSSLPKKLSPNAMITYLTKYYYNDNCTVDEISELVCNEMNKFNLDITIYQEYKAKLRVKRVYTAIINGKTSLLKYFEFIPLYKSEYNQIIKCEDDREKKILFVLYIIARYTDRFGWVYLPESDIYKLANVSTTVKNKEDIISKLIHSGKIKDTKKVDDLKVGVDLSDGNEDIELKVKDFEHLGNLLLSHIKDGYKMCKSCGKLIKIKGNKTMFCKKCAEENELIRKRKNADKYR